MTRRILKIDVEAIRKQVPMTHEIGGTMRFKPDGLLEKVAVVQGDQCRGTDGALLRSGGVCTLRHDEAPVTWHSHPIANRPSSADLLIALARDVRQRARNPSNVRECNVLFTPVGVWTYRPTEALARAADVVPADQKAAWRFLGHHYQDATQRGECDGLIDALRKEGFEIGYTAYDDVGAELSLM